VFFVPKRHNADRSGGADRPERPPIRILAVSDMESKFIWEHFDPEVFRGVNLMISCGDLKASYLSYLVTMIPAPLFYVHGNHDNDYERKPPLGCQCVDGTVVEYKGLRIAGLGGCLGTDPTNPQQFSEAQMLKRVKRLQSDMKRDKSLDIFISHAPAQGIGDGHGFHEGFESFRLIHEQNRPSLHLFGHLHTSGSPATKTGIFEENGIRIINCAGYRILEL